ncbi:HAD family hydrolase [Williamsoniiplasma lucivorax]|uniref:HAD family hydrolase n=2 Tax=Williamsoniiplasma lucivorax TaxID=209274 RepID=A0A2S5RDX9_9MOLU|nr:HAD family hydrolase [Williamsoniiplasma lucivorax]
MLFDQPYEYCLSDCDGTLVGSNLELAKETQKAIKKYQRMSGYRFGLITGRHPLANLKLAHELNVQLPIVACNGAVVMDLKLKQVLFAESIKNALALKFFDDAIKLGLEVTVYSPTQMLTTIHNQRIKTWVTYQKKVKKKYRWDIILFANNAELRAAIASEQFAVVEFILRTSGQQETSIQKLFTKYAKLTQNVQSLPHLYNVTAIGVNKLFGMQKWAEIVKTDYKKIITFGDNYNDLEMISQVEQGIAVGNAVEALKQVAFKVIEPMSENGVGLELERMIKAKE